jgi:Flp pilus assembly pilin Flp
MNPGDGKMKKRGSTLMEYAMILGVVSVVFIGMNTYIKRGLQGRLKEMTDFFIGREQVTKINPTGLTRGCSTRVNTDTNSSINEDRQLRIEGGLEIHHQAITRTTLTTQTEDFTVPPLGPDSFVTSERGQFTPAPAPTQQQ